VLSRGNASVIEDDLLASSKELALVEQYLEELYGNRVMVSATSSF